MKSEIESIYSNQMWMLVGLPNGDKTFRVQMSVQEEEKNI